MAMALLAVGCLSVCAAPGDGRSLCVSKLGDNSDGRTWATAFTTVQAALDAVEDGGGTRIVVRPDTYMEANLSPAHRGAAGACNELIGDVDGSLGSGTAGRVVIDSGDPSRGFKSYDWWGPIRATVQGWSPEHTAPTFSAIEWDRWLLRGLYVTGGDGGLMWDLAGKIEPFTVIVEDCVSIGRAFGGGVASSLSRPDEPVTFRRCHLWALDWWGDTAGGYVRVENDAMPDRPDVVFEDCTLVGPQCALKGGNFGFHTYSRVKLARCRLIVLNFSQPVGTPTKGIIQSVQSGKYLHVDIEDCTLMGYKVFGVIVEEGTEGEIGYTTKGDVRAYVQFQQEVPPGFFRLAGWPVEAFDSLMPPPTPDGKPKPAARELVYRDMCELSPVIWRGKLAHLECHRPAGGGEAKDYWLVLRDVASGRELALFAEGYSLASAIVSGGTLYVYASRFAPDGWNDVTLFESSDLVQWASKVVVKQENENLFNSSVCKSPDGFVMAYESSDPAYPAFTVKFARSRDLRDWTKVEGVAFGRNRYTACPCIRWSGGWYYLLYAEHRGPRHYYQTYIARSRDLRSWELSSANPILGEQGIDEGIDASDPELVEVGGRTLVYFAVGDQLTWMNIKREVHDMPLAEYLAWWFRNEPVPDKASGVAP
jgi:hypothetical protein